MAPSAKNASSNNGDQQQPPPAKKRPIELVDVEENAGEEKGEGFSEVQAKFKKFRKYLEEGGAYESLAKVRQLNCVYFTVETVYIEVRFPFG